MSEQNTKPAVAIDKELHMAMAKVLFHFDRNNTPLETNSDSKWNESRTTYLARSRRMINALAKQGLRLDKQAPTEN